MLFLDLDRFKVVDDERQAEEVAERVAEALRLPVVLDGREVFVSASIGIVSPLVFIPIAAETGLIVPIGQWVLEEACRWAQRWQRFSIQHQPMVVSVNLSARQFQKPDLLAHIERALRETGFDPRQLKLEITESVVMQDAEVTIETLQALKALGIRVAIDDFGTGYSSLSYLKRLPVDTLKIDRSFVAGSATTHRTPQCRHGQDAPPERHR